MGDLNEQLQSNVDGVTGNFTGGVPSKNSKKIVDILRLNNLAAVNTFFRPKDGKSVHTFLQTKRNQNNEDAGLYVGRSVKEKYHGKWIQGEVKAMSWTQGNPEWTVQFEDDYVTKYNEKQLKKKRIHVETEKTGHQIDYICVSRRWVSCVRKARVRWAPSIHRDQHGEKNDHGLVESTWKWRIRSPKH